MNLQKIKECVMEAEEHKTSLAEIISIMSQSDMAKLDPNERKIFIAWLTEQSAAGNSVAQDQLGDMYYYGKYVTPDYIQSIKLFAQSDKLGNACGTNNLIFMYRRHHQYKITLTTIINIMNEISNNGATYKTIISENTDFFDLYNENEKLKESNKQLTQENTHLKEENERLQTEITYMPGGSGYEIAKQHAESIFDTVSKSTH